MAVRMGVDETGMQQPARGGDLDRIGRSRAAGRTDLADRVVLDQNIGGFYGSCGDVEHLAAAQDRISHGILFLKTRGIIARGAEGAEPWPV